MAKSKYYGTKHWLELRQVALKRDKWYCTICKIHCLGRKYGRPAPIVDHIKPRPYFDAPTDFDVLENLQVLCPKCHQMKTARGEAEAPKEIGANGFPVGGEW